MSREGFIPTPVFRPEQPQQSQFGAALSRAGGITNKLFQNPAFVGALANFGQRLSNAPGDQPFRQSFAGAIGNVAPDFLAGQQAQQQTEARSAEQELANLLTSAKIKETQARTGQIGRPDVITPFQERSLELQQRRLAIQQAASTQQITQKEADVRLKKVAREAQFRDAEATITNNVTLLDELIAHPGFSAVVGAKGISTGFTGFGLPGSDAANFQARFEQIKSIAFLEGFQQLKGAGAISEAEGKKGETAITRLSTAQSEKAFLSAVKELKEVMQAGLARKQKSGGFVPIITPPPQPQVLPQSFPQTPIATQSRFLGFE